MDMETLARTLRASGLRLTRQRRLVYELLVRSHEHLDAGKLFERVRRRAPGISLATVYRTMTLFRQMGLVKALPLGESHRHFEPASETGHHHMVCSGCGRVIEFEAPELGPVLTKLGSTGWVVGAIELCVIGTCPDCRQAEHRS